LLEFLRLDPSRVAGINANQILMLVVAVLSVGTLIWRHRQQFGFSPGTADAQD
jgi:hypothetical protein